MCGATTAWFLSEVNGPETLFTAGTVDLGTPELVSGSGSWEKGQWNTVTWSITNTGSESCHLRIRPHVTFDAACTEDIWCEGENFTGASWMEGRYFKYNKGSHGEETPRKVDLLMGAEDGKIKAGYLDAWDDGTHLYIRYNLDDGYTLEQTQINVATKMTGKGQAHDYTVYPWQYSSANPLTDSTFSTDYVYEKFHEDEDEDKKIFSGLKEGAELCIAVHVNAFTVQLVDWKIGAGYENDWSEVDEDGWYYYGTTAGPAAVSPEEALQLSLELYPYFTGSITVQLEAEVLQTSQSAIDTMWPGHPWR